MTAAANHLVVRSRALWIAGAVVGLVLYGTLVRSGLYQSPQRAFLISIIVEPVAFLLMGLLLRLAPWWARADLNRIELAVRMAAICVPAAILQAGLARTVIGALGWTVTHWTASDSWTLPAAYYFFLFTSWCLARLWLDAELRWTDAARRASSAEADALRRELLFLRRQLDPHFLFNALNGITSEVVRRPAVAVECIQQLSRYLRYSLDFSEPRGAPIGREIDAMMAYLAVQSARFGDELQHELTVIGRAAERRTPGFILQPFIENAIKHGLQSPTRPVRISVVISEIDDGIVLRVSNTGRLPDRLPPPTSDGVGLAVLSRRLELHYPDRHHLELYQRGDSVVAALTLRGEARWI